MNIPEKIIEITTQLDRDFWEAWRELTDDFPDIDNMNYLKLVVLQTSLTTIVLNYIIGFRKEVRVEELENFITRLREIEAQVRDIQGPYP